MSRSRTSLSTGLAFACTLTLVAAAVPASLALGAPAPGPGSGPVVMVDCSGVAAWSASQVYTGGTEARHNNSRWRAKWWTQGDTPGSADVWANVGPCDGGPNPPPPGPQPPPPGCGGLPAWSSSQVYTGGQDVQHNGRKWRAKWWTQGETPGSAQVWADQGACGPTTPPPPPPPPGPQPPPPPPGGMRVAPYYFPGFGHPLPNPATVIQATGVRFFTMAFVLANGCNAVWDGENSLTGGQHQASINAIRAAGGDIVPSIGGWSGSKLGPNCSTPQALAAQYIRVIDTFNLRAIDLDIENSDEFENDAVRNRIIAALKIVKQQRPNVTTIVTIPTLIEGPSFFGRLLIEEAARTQAGIDNFTIMPFNFGAGDMVAATASSVNGLRNQLMTSFGWNAATANAHMGISGMNGLSDRREVTTVAQWRTIVQQHSSLARISFWGVNRDRACPDGGVSSSCSGIGGHADWDFTRASMGR